MNRTGLLIALAVAVLAGLVFGLYPELDLAIAALFFNPATKRFISTAHPWLGLLRETAMWLITLLVIPAIVALAIKLIAPRRPLLMSGRAIIFLLGTLAFGPGLVVNVGLKDYWGRSRPIDVPQLGGEERFTAWWDPRGVCPKNCSFVTGDGSGAFWTLAPAALAPPAWRPAAYAGALALGSGVGFLRMAFGGHFFSDIVFAAVITFLIIWVAYGLIYRWPRTRLTDQALERAIERVALPPHDFVMRLFRKVGG